MTSTTPRFAELAAPAHWQVVDFISDLHLQASEPETFQTWANYMAHSRADALFILGDLFEVWVGDDVLTTPPDAAARTDISFEAQCAAILRARAQRSAVFVMHGNRDFLVGAALARHCGLQLLDDPTVLVLQEQRWLLSHGDALCLDDQDYLKFRQLVRNPAWQSAILGKPLSERRAIARGIRTESESRKESGAIYADVDAAEVQRWLHAAGCTDLIHGHTHRPATHALDAGLRRHVLSDWDSAAQPPRADVLRWQAQSAPGQLLRLRPQDAA